MPDLCLPERRFTLEGLTCETFSSTVILSQSIQDEGTHVIVAVRATAAMGGTKDVVQALGNAEMVEIGCAVQLRGGRKILNLSALSLSLWILH